MDSTEILRFIVRGASHRFRDENGRPFDEQGARKDPRVRTELKQSPYPGTRYMHPLPMNASALRDVSAKWSDVLGIVDATASEYERRFGRRQDVGAIFDISNLLHAIPDYLALRPNEPTVDGKFTAAAAGTFKVVQGFIVLAAIGYAEFSATGKRSETWSEIPALDPSSLYRYIEDRRLLIGSNEVCGATQAMLEEIYGVMVGATPSKTGPHVLRELDRDFSTFFEFGSRIATMRRLVLAWLIRERQFTFARPPELSSDVWSRAEAYLEQGAREVFGRRRGIWAFIANQAVFGARELPRCERFDPSDLRRLLGNEVAYVTLRRSLAADLKRLENEMNETLWNPLQTTFRELGAQMGWPGLETNMRRVVGGAMAPTLVDGFAELVRPEGSVRA